MATAAKPIICSKGLLDLLRQIIPLQERVVELYSRLLAINELSNAINSAHDLESLKDFLEGYFQEYLPGESIRLCLKNGEVYRRLRLSTSSPSTSDDAVPLNKGIAGSVIQSVVPLWIPDAPPSHDRSSFSGTAEETGARSICVLPLSARDGSIGCLEMLSNQPNRFDEIEYHLGLLVAAHVASSLENLLTRQKLTTANARLKDHDLRLTQLNERLKQLAHTDESTGLFNKRRLFEQLEMEIARARRYGEIFTCLMLDIDDFKRINDTYGHQAGDEVLRQVGNLFRRSLRVTDFIARFGGEEFTIILPRTNSAGGHRVAEHLLSTFMSHEFAVPGAAVHVTVSIGAVCCTTFDRLDPQQVITQADNAMYRAKRRGKNQTCFADESEVPNTGVRILSNK
jgi:diguanylate cyclase (GGDEF)-like protein